MESKWIGNGWLFYHPKREPQPLKDPENTAQGTEKSKTHHLKLKM
jgi:hypothetical protein